MENENAGDVGSAKDQEKEQLRGGLDAYAKEYRNGKITTCKGNDITLAWREEKRRINHEMIQMRYEMTERPTCPWRGKSPFTVRIGVNRCAR